MIEVKVGKNAFVVEGHAAVGTQQAAVVCAIVSVMTEAVASGAVRFAYGRHRFMLRKRNSQALLICLRVLAERFPKNICVRTVPDV